MRKGLLFSINLSINLLIIIIVIIILEKMTQAIYFISTTVVKTYIYIEQ